MDPETLARIEKLRQWCRQHADLRDEEGIPSPTKLAVKTEKKVSYWSDVLRNTKSFGAKVARATERSLGMPDFYLEGVLQEKAVAARVRSVTLREGATDFVIQQFDAGGAMGHGVTLPEQPGVIHSWRVSPEWVQKNVRGYTSLANLCIVTGFGDSMRPLYNPGDPLLVDRGVRRVEMDSVFFFRLGDEGFIKRLQRIPGEGLVAISDNPRYREWTIRDDMDFELFGRVLKVWCSAEF